MYLISSPVVEVASWGHNELNFLKPFLYFCCELLPLKKCIIEVIKSLFLLHLLKTFFEYKIVTFYNCSY